MLSIVVPVFNEAESLNNFYQELIKTLSAIKETHEIIFVDDGSDDNSLDILKSLVSKNKKVRVFSFRRNLGKSEALTLGFTKSVGDIIVTLDADLQDKPSEIPKFIELNKKGIDLVCGWRKERRDKKKMLVISKLFNKITNLAFGLKIHDYNCGFKSYTSDLAKNLRLYGGLHRFIPLIANQKGFTIDEIPVQHDIRKAGKSKYGFSKVFKDIPDLFTMYFLAKFSKKPLHFFGFIGGAFAFIGFIVLSYLSYLRFNGESIGNRPLLLFGVLLFITGLQIFFTGFLADLIISISQNSKMEKENVNFFPIKYSSE
ncbi:MAG TPA: glycosyltransferase family 2 protein [Candidatus Limnocylindrales bacterium]|nr:glycosyltransferase family 2 protein [Candidatus Limnocylindrales bacterium]